MTPRVGFPTGPHRVHSKFLVLRGLTIVGCGLGGLGLLVIYLIWAWQGLSSVRHDAETWAAGGLELHAEKLTFRVELPNEPAVDVEFQLTTRGHFLLTTPDENRVLALVPPEAPERAILMQPSFYPLELTSDLADRVHGAMAAAEVDGFFGHGVDLGE